MHALGQYILSVGFAALLTAVICDFSDRKSSTGTLIRMVCGLFLAFTAINPIAGFNWGILDAFSANLTPDSTTAVSAGTTMAEESMVEYIKQRTRSYILDKARSLGCNLEAHVAVGEGSVPVPVSVQIIGEVPVSAKKELEALLEQELGISKENQQWIG